METTREGLPERPMSSGRAGFSSPEKILEQIEIREQMEAADFGCGHGFFSILLAKRIPKGKVYALDVVKEALEAVQSRAKLEKIDNIETIQANLENFGGSKLKNNSMDIVLIRNILFQSQKKEEIIREAKRALKKGGEMVIIEWKADSVMAPKEGWLIEKEMAKKLAESDGLNFKKEMIIDSHHYGLVFNK
jgi:ubiquinone/menaquinone biosynthesis C-methylase UbiE